MVSSIKKYRQVKGWSQSRLARESKVSQTFISELEAGKWTPNISILRKLANAGCTHLNTMYVIAVEYY